MKPWLEKSLKIVGTVAALLFGEYVFFVLLAVSYGGTLSGAGGYPERFLFLFALLAVLDLVAALSVFTPRKKDVLQA